jgi:hypothetical protein
MTTAFEEARIEYLYAIMHGLEAYFLVCPQWKEGKFIMPDIEGSPVMIDWEYCSRKIVSQKTWERKDVRAYSPVVSM